MIEEKRTRKSSGSPREAPGERQGALHLGRQHPLGRLRGVLSWIMPPPGHAGGVDHAVDGAEAGRAAATARRASAAVGDVGGDGQHLAAQRLEGEQTCADAAAGAVLLAVRGQPRAPAPRAAGSGVRPTSTSRACHRAGQELGQRQAEAAEAAGDQVDAPLPQAAGAPAAPRAAAGARSSWTQRKLPRSAATGSPSALEDGELRRAPGRRARASAPSAAGAPRRGSGRRGSGTRAGSPGRDRAASP